MASKKRSGTPNTSTLLGPSAADIADTQRIGRTSFGKTPQSPTRTMRIQEKQEFQSLNDRLACYIDRVRYLEQENSRLVTEVRTSRESVTREVTNIKSMYDHELSDARKLLDETSLEKAKMEIDLNRMWSEIEDLKNKLSKQKNDLSVAETNARLYESRYKDVNQQLIDLKDVDGERDRLRAQLAKKTKDLAASEELCTQLNQKYHKALGDAKDAEAENIRLRQKLVELQKSLEEETLARVDLENKIQSLKEELTFNDQVHQREMHELRRSQQVEVTETDGRIYEEYEARLQKSLQELRDQYEDRMHENRDEMEQMYASKMKALENAVARSNSSASSIMEELRQSRTTIGGLNTRLKELEAANDSLNVRIRDLERTLEDERKRHATEREMLDRELSRLQKEMAERMQEYLDLMDTKTTFDMEFAAYDNLLKAEEARLSISHSEGDVVTMSQSSSSGVARGSGARTPTRAAAAKRKRIAVDDSIELQKSDYETSSICKGDVQIIEQDSQGRFVKLHNKSKNEVAIGGWQIVRTAGNEETNFKLHRSVKIEPNGHVTIWSSDAGATHEPPTNIVMKTQKWVTGNNVKTQLLNGNAEEVAVVERIRVSVSSNKSGFRQVSSSGGGGSAMFGAGSSMIHEEMFHQQGDPRPGLTENCRMM